MEYILNSTIDMIPRLEQETWSDNYISWICEKMIFNIFADYVTFEFGDFSALRLIEGPN